MKNLIITFVWQTSNIYYVMAASIVLHCYITQFMQ